MTVPTEIRIPEQRQSSGIVNDDTTATSTKRESAALFQLPALGRVGLVGSTWERRRETIAVYLCSLYFIMPMIAVCWYWSVIFFIFPLTTVPIASYMGYFLLLDKSAESGKYTPWIRSWTFWSYACDYFPLLLVKTADLSPERSYVMGYHPHGIISVGAMGSFATDGAITIDLVKDEVQKGNNNNNNNNRNNNAVGGTVINGDDKDGNDDNNNVHDDQNDAILPTNCTDSRPRGFTKLFPGIDRRLVTLPINFSTPFLREYILGLGCCDSNKISFRSILKRNGGKGNAMVVVVGGAAESLLVKPGSIELILEKRHGFVREAIISDACLVPILAFGETDLYHIVESHDANGWVRHVQDWVKATTGVAVPLFRGRSLFFKDFGLMPLRKPIVVVVGKPISPPSLPPNTIFNPLVDRNTREPQNEHGRILLEWHGKYVTSLKELYETYKDKNWNTAGKSRHGSMRIVQ